MELSNYAKVDFPFGYVLPSSQVRNNDESDKQLEMGLANHIQQLHSNPPQRKYRNINTVAKSKMIELNIW